MMIPKRECLITLTPLPPICFSLPYGNSNTPIRFDRLLLLIKMIKNVDNEYYCSVKTFSFSYQFYW